MDDRIDLICQHTREGGIIPIKIRLKDEDGELQDFVVKGYRDTSEYGVISFDCKIMVRDTMKIIKIYSTSNNLREWHFKYKK